MVFTFGEKWPESHSGKAAALVTSCKGSRRDAEGEQPWASCPREGQAFQTVTAGRLVLETRRRGALFTEIGNVGGGESLLARKID